MPAMPHGQYVFSQLMDHMPLIKRFAAGSCGMNGDRKVEQFSCRDQLRCLGSHSGLAGEPKRLRGVSERTSVDDLSLGTSCRAHRAAAAMSIFLALTVMERTPEKPKEPVLFVLDEFPVLGHMQPIETAAGLMAGYGVKLWTIVQNIGQLKQHYDKSWETFFANAGVVTGFGVIDQESQRALSAKLGKLRMTTQVPTGAAGSELLKGTRSQRDERFNVPLLAEDELGVSSTARQSVRSFWERASRRRLRNGLNITGTRARLDNAGRLFRDARKIQHPSAARLFTPH